MSRAILVNLHLSHFWQLRYNMSRSTIFMPCNDSGFTDPQISADWGVVDFDWSNGKRAWTLAQPMDCEERLVSQAELVKSVNPDAKVWVYRNLVKALPWYSSVREKMLDPAYAGFFLKFDAKNSTPYHVPQCSVSTIGNEDKCSKFYHDQEQTPQNGPNHLGPTKTPDGWTVWQPYNGCGGGMVHCDAANRSESCQVWLAPETADWQSCSKAADIAMQTNPLIRIFTWWPVPPSPQPLCLPNVADTAGNIACALPPHRRCPAVSARCGSSHPILMLTRAILMNLHPFLNTGQTPTLRPGWALAG